MDAGACSTGEPERYGFALNSSLMAVTIQRVRVQPMFGVAEDIDATAQVLS